MGTTTIFKRWNDLARRELSKMSKKELKDIDKLSPWSREKEMAHGWSCPMELHNGNINVLIWWHGRLMKLEDAPSELTDKYYNRFRGKRMKEYEWTLLSKYIRNQLDYLDNLFKKIIRKKKLDKKS